MSMDHAWSVKTFWSTLANSGLLSLKNLVVAGDLNLTLSTGEVWGGSAASGQLSGFFNSLFQAHKLIDVQPDKVVPTWRNGRSGYEAITKRLDRFLVSEDLLLEVRLYRTWVEYPYVSDHAPIIFQMENTIIQKAFPFKFHAQWLAEKEFNDMVIKLWKDQKYLQEGDCQGRFVWKLKDLKAITKRWAREKKARDTTALENLEGNIKYFLQKLSEGNSLAGGGVKIIRLESERNKHLKSQEDLWRIQSRAIWVQSGDQNNKFFHQFANHRRNNKFIWEIFDNSGTIYKGQKAIAEEAVKYFKNFFKPSLNDISTEQVRVASQYPKMLDENEAGELYKPVTLLELEAILKLFKKEKSPGPDGWSVELYLHFFDLMGEDLLALVEETRTSGRITGSINSTFIALIPKSNKPQQFRDYKPISLCNLVYKVISKVIANRIKPILSRSLSEEQLGFLEGRQIQDAIGTAHECIHSIKKKNIKSLILKLDLQKAYDCISWDYLRMVLIQVGFGLHMKNWILACVNSTSFAVLVNGEATNFLEVVEACARGVRYPRYYLSW
jgi:hypothetical protein